MAISTIGTNSLNQTSDLTINGQTVGKGGGNVATNTVHGAGAMAATATGRGNIAFGVNAGAGITTGETNIAIGSGVSGLCNSALQFATAASNNVAIGPSALQNTTGSNNIGIGNSVLASNSSGASNVGVGYQALLSNTTASNNTAVGYTAGYAITTGAGNTAIGYLALDACTTGNSNTAVGNGAGGANTTGAQNIFIGLDSGNATISHTTGSYNTFIGRCNGSSSSATNQLVITASNSVIAGKGDSTGFISPSGGGVYQGNNSSSWSTTSDQRLKKNIVDNTDGLNKITAVRVRNFEYRLPEEVEELDQTCAVPNKGVQLGVIAQELQAVLPDCVKTESTGVLSVDPDNLTWHMVNAIKDLKALVDAQAAEIAELKAKVA